MAREFFSSFSSFSVFVVQFNDRGTLQWNPLNSGSEMFKWKAAKEVLHKSESSSSFFNAGFSAND
jgi:hypothetical protein